MGIAFGWPIKLFLVAACTGEPEFVYVLESSQAVELAISASATTVTTGEGVVLQVNRRTSGAWKRIPMKSRTPDQCWMRRPPLEFEPEVADNVRWDVAPAGAAQFNTDFRPDRTRRVVFSEVGVYFLTPSSAVWCEPGRSVATKPIRIEVTAK